VNGEYSEPTIHDSQLTYKKYSYAKKLFKNRVAQFDEE